MPLCSIQDNSFLEASCFFKSFSIPSSYLDKFHFCLKIPDCNWSAVNLSWHLLVRFPSVASYSIICVSSGELPSLSPGDTSTVSFCLPFWPSPVCTHPHVPHHLQMRPVFFLQESPFAARCQNQLELMLHYPISCWMYKSGRIFSNNQTCPSIPLLQFQKVVIHDRWLFDAGHTGLVKQSDQC